MANDECFFSMEVDLVTGERLYSDALDEEDYPCTLTINEFIEKVENKFDGKVVDIKYGEGTDIVVDMDELKLKETLEELYNRTGKEETNAFFITMRANKANNGPRVSMTNLGKLKKAEKNAKAALNAERRNGNSRKALNAASKAHNVASAALRNAQMGTKGGATRKNRKNRKTRKNRK